MANDAMPTFLATFYTDKTLGQYGLGKLSDAGRAIGAVQAYHRANIPQDCEAPFAVANEFICSEFGRLVGLPIPPGALTRSAVKSSEVLFSCLDFECSYGSLVDAEADRCCDLLLKECTGLVLFDMIVANPDREHWNLKTDDSRSPTFIRVYDHADALFNNVGIARLQTMPHLWSGLSWPLRPERDQHFLSNHLASGTHFAEWYHKFESIPKWQIENICQAARKGGISATEAKVARDFIDYRRLNIENIVKGNRGLFPASLFEPPKDSLI